MKARIFPLLSMLACADPAVLEVTVSVQETNLSDIVVTVNRNGSTLAPLANCRLALGQPAEGQCPFEEGSLRWEDPNRIAFILYGTPSTPVSFTLDGRRDGRVVTSTGAATQLPDDTGERQTVRLALLGRTQERFRCTVDLPEGVFVTSLSPENQTDVLAIEGFRSNALQLVTSSHAALVATSYQKTAEGCALSSTMLLDSDLRPSSRPMPDDAQLWCHTRLGSLVAGWNEDGSRLLVAGVCDDRDPARLKIAVIDPQGEVQVTEFLFDNDGMRLAPNRISDPVLADTNGDGISEIIMVAHVLNGAGQVAGNELYIFRPMQDAPTRIPISTPNIEIGRPLSPLILPALGTGGETLVLTWSRGDTLVFVTNDTQQVLTWGTGRRDLIARRAPSGTVLSDGRAMLVSVAGLGVNGANVVNGLVFAPDRGQWRQMDAFSGMISSGIDTDFAVRGAWGALNRDVLNLVFADQGQAQVISLTSPPTAQTIDVWNGTLSSGAQHILLANLDGEPGAEVLSFDIGSSVMHAVDAQGTPVDGWPLEFSGLGGARRGLVADLDGPSLRDPQGLRDTEVVLLADRRLEVITLGPGSYDVATPWPYEDWSARGGGVRLGNVDPARSR